MGTVLLVDDDVNLLTSFARVLSNREHHVITAGSAEEAISCVANVRPEVIVMDFCMPGMNGLEAFIALKTSAANIPVIIMTGESSMSIAVEAAALGVSDFHMKPFEPKAMIESIERAAASCRDTHLPPSTVAPNLTVDNSAIVGGCPSMQAVYKGIGRAAPTDVTVLIRGESGTGKELVAKAVHLYSRRKNKPFVAINCMAIPEALLESELFGHERGAFTGATSRRIGKFEQAEGGTLFLDEIGDMPLGVQGKILRVLQERVLTRVGSNDPVNVDVRVLAATNRNLEQAVADGTYREDLYHRLNVVSIKLPPLRERHGDIPMLVSYFVDKHSAEQGVARLAVSQDAIDLLSEQAWPGNVRELAHCLCRAMIFNPGMMLDADHIRQALGSQSDQQQVDEGMHDERLRDVVRHQLFKKAGEQPFQTLMAKVEALLVLEALRLTRGNQSHAAKLLGMSRETFRSKLKKYTDQLSIPELGQIDVPVASLLQ